MLSKLTIVGLSQFSPDIWDNLSLPEGIDKEVFISEVVRQGGEFSLIYPDADFMKYQIGEFSKKWYHNFERWYQAYNFEYEALYNLDVKSTITEEGHNEEEGEKNTTDSRRDTSSSSGNSSGNNSNTHSKAAYDSQIFQPTEKDEGSSSINSHNSGENTSNGSGNEKTNASSNHSVVTEEYRRGNQGVTMSQEMLLAEYNAWRSNIYTMMAEVFVSEFCVCIYN